MDSYSFDCRDHDTLAISSSARAARRSPAKQASRQHRLASAGLQSPDVMRIAHESPAIVDTNTSCPARRSQYPGARNARHERSQIGKTRCNDHYASGRLSPDVARLRRSWRALRAPSCELIAARYEGRVVLRRVACLTHASAEQWYHAGTLSPENEHEREQGQPIGTPFRQHGAAR